MELETVATNEIKIFDVHLLKLNRLLDTSMKNGSGNIVLQAYIVKEILRNNSHSVFDVLINGTFRQLKQSCCKNMRTYTVFLYYF